MKTFRTTAALLGIALAGGSMAQGDLFEVRFLRPGAQAPPGANDSLRDGDAFIVGDSLYLVLKNKRVFGHLSARNLAPAGGSASLRASVRDVRDLAIEVRGALSLSSGLGVEHTAARSFRETRETLGALATIALPGTQRDGMVSLVASAQDVGANPRAWSRFTDLVVDSFSDRIGAQARRLEAAIAASAIGVEVSLVVSRDPSRRTDIDPLAFLNARDDDEAKAALDQANAVIAAIEGGLARANELCKTFEKHFSDLRTKAQAAVEKLKDDPDLLVLKGRVAALASHADDALARFKATKTPLDYLLSQAFLDLETLDTDWRAVSTALDELTGDARQKADKLLKELSEEALESLPFMKELKALVDVLNGLKPQYQEIERIARKVVLSESEETLVPFDFKDGGFGSVRLRPEDRIVLSANARTGEEENPVPLGETTLYALRRRYVGGLTASLGTMYKGSSHVQAGVARFATFHFAERGPSAIPLNVSAAIGLGTAQSRDGGSAGATLHLGIALWRDNILVGVGRNLGTNTNFAFLGLRVRAF